MRPLEEPAPLEERTPRDLVVEMLEYAVENDLDTAPLLLALYCCVGRGERVGAEELAAPPGPVSPRVPKHFYPH